MSHPVNHVSEESTGRLFGVPSSQAQRIIRAIQALCALQGGASPSKNVVGRTLALAMSDRDLTSLKACLATGGGRVRVQSTLVHTGEPFENRTESKTPKKVGPLWLESKRGTRVNSSRARCSMPGCIIKPTVRYAKSTWGTVRLCARHRDEARDRSFGRVDASRVAVDSRRLNHDHRDGRGEGFRRG